MKFICLGSSWAFSTSKENFQSNFMIQLDEKRKLLIDCGTDIRYSLQDNGFSYHDVTDIYISHLHMDHAGGLEYIGFSTKFDSTCQKPRIYTHKSIGKIIRNHLLKGCMSVRGEKSDIKVFFEPKFIGDELQFTWEGIRFNLIKTCHTRNNNEFIPCYGLFFQLNGKKITFTADTQFDPETFMSYFQESDIIFHECETNPYRTGIHSNYQDLKTLPDNIKAKMWLYHINEKFQHNPQQDGFLGFLKKGQIFEF